MFIHAFSYVTDRSFYLSTTGEPIGVGMIVALYLAEGSGNLRLRSANPTDKPLLDYNYLVEESDRRRLREGVRLCARFGEWDSYAAVIESPLNPTGADLTTDGRAGRLDFKQHPDQPPRFQHLQNGPLVRSRRGGGPRWIGARNRWSARGRRVDNARLREGQHQSDDDDDRRANRGPHQRQGLANPPLNRAKGPCRHSPVARGAPLHCPNFPGQFVNFGRCGDSFRLLRAGICLTISTWAIEPPQVS